MAGNSQRRGARQRGKGIGSSGRTAGSGGRSRRALEGKGPTPKAEDRVYHKAYQAKRDASAGGGASGGAGRGAGQGGGARSSSGRGAGQGGSARATGARGSHSDQGGSARAGGLRPGSRSDQGGRRQAGADWVVGRNAVLEALQAKLPVTSVHVAEGAERDARLRDIFQFAADHSLPLLQSSRAELDRLTGGAVHQGVALRLPPYDYADPGDLLDRALETDGLVVACDQITDPHNLGAIIRSAAAFGAVGVLIPTRRSAQLTAAAWKASAGAAALVPVAKAANLNQALAEFRRAGCALVGLAGDAAETIDQLALPVEGPLVLVVGSEGEGLARLTRERCDALARIPIAETVESLNASVAVGVALYALAGRRAR